MISAHTAPVPAHVTRALDMVDLESGAWITVASDRAVSAALSAPEGPLSGKTFAIKDVFDTAGVRTTYGSPLYADNVPVISASIVTRLERAGAVWIGKTNLNEFAYGVSGYNPTFGVIRSPLNGELTAGGSSGGSAAAVGAGTVDFALGTDTSGSVRIPAACCGIIGFKSANGSQPIDGVYPLAPTLDSVGFLTRDVETLQLLLDIDELPDARRLRVGNADDLSLPPLPDAHWALFRAQSYAIHKERSELYPLLYGRDLRAKLGLAPLPTEGATESVARWKESYLAAFDDVDIVTGPVFDGSPITVEDALRDYSDDTLRDQDRLIVRTAPANALGWPAMSVPTESGPVHLMAKPGREAHLLAYAQDICLPAAAA